MELVKTDIVFIGSEEKEVLNHLLALCVFTNAKQKREFWGKVLAAGQANNINEITEDNFELAYNQAKKILHALGDEILRGRHKNALHNMRYVQGIRRLNSCY
jgi:hypothetical protein